MKKLTWKITVFLIGIFFITLISCKKTFQVTFDVGDGEYSYLKINVDKNNPLPKEIINSEPTLENYIFIGWINSESNTMWDDNDKITKNLTLIAVWQKLIYIDYQLDGGTNNGSNPTYFKKNAPLYPAEKEGYTFLYWEFNGNRIERLPETVEEEIVLIAHYKLIGPKIIYELDGGENNQNNPEIYKEGEMLYAPNKLGYTFLYWKWNNEIVTTLPISDEDIVLIAYYEINEYKIIYDLNGGNNHELNPSTFTVLDLPLDLNDAELEGYTFMGWEIGNSKIVRIPCSESYCKDLTIKANFGKNYKITYLQCEDFDISSFPTTYVSSINLVLPTLNKKGYVFDGWVNDSTIITRITKGTTGDIEIYPSFDLANYTITYELDGGNNSEKNPTSFTIFSQVINLKAPTKTGYTFIGWKLDDNYVTKISPELCQDIVLKAIWEKDATYHKLIYVLNGGVLEDSFLPRFEEGVETTLPVPTKSNYRFLGWNLNDDGTGNYLTTISDSETNDLILYAIWDEKIPEYNINYVCDGITIIGPNTYIEGTSTILPIPKKEGYSFNGWYLNPDYSDLPLKEISIYCKGDLTLYAKFVKENENFKINYFLNGGSIDSNDVVYEFTIKSGIIKLPTAVRKGYTFLGWENEDLEIVDEIDSTIGTDINLIATFETTEKTYQIKYILETGALSLNTVYCFTENDEFLLYEPTLDNAVFDGWYLNANFVGEKIDKIEKGTKRNYVFYGNFIQTTYKINFYFNDDLIQILKYDTTTIPDLIELNKDGYEFIGWATKAGQIIDQIPVETKCDIDLYAIFEPIIDENITHKVTFLNYDKSTLYQIDVIHGLSISNIGIGNVKGLKLDWYYNGELYDFNSIITEDIVLNANWVVIDDIFASIFTSKKIYEDIIIKKQFDTVGGQINVRWSSDLPSFINMSTGVVNLDYQETKVLVTGEFTLDQITLIVTKEIIVDKVNFVDLSKTSPVIGYFYTRTASCEISQVTIDTLDIINYGFARATETGTVDISELRSIDRMISLRKQGIRVLLCFGGYGEAGVGFSKMAKTQSGREKLAQAILEVVETYHFDGVDIDWEYPGYYTGTDVSIDRPNYTLLIKEISETLKAANPNYLVTAALPGGKYGYTRYELDKVGEILDYVNLMTYDLQNSSVSTHHTALYNNGNYTPHGSVEQTTELYGLKIDKKKLIIGIAFYGRKFYVTSNDSGIGHNNEFSQSSSITYTSIYEEYLKPIENGVTSIKRYFDDIAKAPYIYDGHVWITYDDPESIKYKSEYVKKNGYGGLMFWDYGEDETLQLIQAIYENFKK